MLNVTMSMVLANKHINPQTLFSKTIGCWENTRKLGDDNKIPADFQSPKT